MRIYLAAHFERRLAMREVADKLWSYGYEIVSTWLQEVSKPPTMDHATFFRKLAIKDLTEIKAADLLILDTHEPSERGGKEVEFGYGIGCAQSKEVWIVGPKRNVFHELADKHFGEWQDCLDYLKGVKNVQKD